MRITTAKKLTLVLGAFVLVAGVSVGAILIRDSAQFLRERSLQRLDATTHESAARLGEMFDALAQDLYLLASLGALQSLAEGQEQDRQQTLDLLRQVMLKYPWYTRVRLFGHTDRGREIAGVERREPAAPGVTGTGSQDGARAGFLRRALALPAGEILFSAVQAGPPAAGPQPPQHILRAAVALGPEPGGSNQGLLEIDADLEVIFKRLSSELPAAHQLLVFNLPGGRLLFPDPAGYLAPGDAIAALRALPLSSRSPVRMQLEQPGQERLLSIQEVALPGRGPERVFGVAVALPLSDLHGEADYLLVRGAWITLGLALLAAVAGMLLAQWLNFPVKRLVQLVHGYKAGDAPSAELPLGRQDEVGALARALAGMMGRIREQMGQIKDERARLRGLVETAADAIIVIDTQGVIQQTNSAVSRLFGYAPEELAGSNVKMLMVADDAQRHDGYLHNYRKTGVASIIGVGREVFARRADGELIQVYLSVGEFSAQGECYYVGILHDITEHKRMEAELIRLAQTDELTGVSNRRHFMGQLEKEIRRSDRYTRSLSLMIIDLDYFKQVNDTFGHAVGDLALREVVELLGCELREQDELARLGGDEFAVLLPETRAAAAYAVAQRIIQRAAATVIDETERHLSLSIGVAGWRPGMGNGDLLRAADGALYRAKADGRGRAFALSDGE